MIERATPYNILLAFAALEDHSLTANFTMSRPSAASEAFRKCSADLIKVIPDQGLLVLAWELYSVGVVSKPAVEGLSLMEKKTKLLSAVGDQIDVEPSKFENLLQALRKQAPLKDVTDKLETTYKECGK